MKAKLLICVCILTVVTFAVGNTYACCQSPVASFSANPNPVCIDTQVSFDASASNDPDGTTLTYSWSFGSGAYDITGAATATPTCKYNSAGYKTVTLTVTDNDNPECCDQGDPDCSDKSDSTQRTVTVVRVDKIQYDDPDTGWTYIQPSPAFALYVYKGTTVTFKAIPDPSGASWPSGKPVWGGSSGASGTGSTTQVTFNTLSSNLYPPPADYKTVTATCGNTITIYVIVFDFEGVFTPHDDFDGRHTMYYGIEEKVELSFETDPWSVPAGQAGGLEWTKGSGPGTLSDVDIDYGTAEYDAGATDGTVWLSLTIKSGPSKGRWKGYQKDVILPSGTRMTLAHPGYVWHIQGTASAGIALYYWLDPKHVSFKYLTFGEDSCPLTGDTGIFITDPPNPPNHQQNTFGTILGGNITTGCRVEEEDQAGFIRYLWGSGGTYTWSIPTQYIDDTSARNTFGSNQNHVPVIQANGDATINKGGQSGSAALNATTQPLFGPLPP